MTITGSLGRIGALLEKKWGRRKIRGWPSFRLKEEKLIGDQGLKEWFLT